ncbi:efflux RND transporter periplasmic adaptor subunit [Lacimicrobium alkaliphilum]|uniref:Hemolysin secretion protein D n=1 Tax=Lacimicrobium alkaliphilum TaxID=1526571 RepID=A0A0U3APN2_9ALTE|nr:efflux RND transporter periplasmic adaptor subunit [Lacimicrobium alkaliphilum]ALS99858.1 hemolysin secretion protein D [Lacimicrobium alkaliphilum]
MHLPVQRRTLALLAVIVPLLVLLVYVALRTGPLSPVPVTEARVESREIHPALFGIGTVEARYTYKIGPTFAGRVGQLVAQVGDYVQAGDVLGEMEPVDLEDRVRSQEAAVKRVEAAITEAIARHTFAQTQARRYEDLYAARSVSEEALTIKRQELAIAEAVLAAARADLARAHSEHDALVAQRRSLYLIAPVDGVVTQRSADPGTTVVAGQAVVELIDPDSLWINVRFDQVSAAGLAADLPATIVLHSQNGQGFSGRVQRVEMKADAVTEEILAKVIFDQIPLPLPRLGELAEVMVDLPALPASPLIPNAAIQRQGNQSGVWQIINDKPVFIPVILGRSELDGDVQVLEGIEEGDRIIVYSEKALDAHSRIHLVDRIPGVSK